MVGAALCYTICMKSIMTLCVIRQGDEILLAEKKRGFGVGFWNGYGGKLEGDETIAEALIREIREESGLTLTSFEKRGEMYFHLSDGSTKEVHLFEGIEYTGDLVETEEMKPAWFSVNNLPFDNMWASDALWYPYFLRREYFKCDVTFDEGKNVLSSKFY